VVLAYFDRFGDLTGSVMEYVTLTYIYIVLDLIVSRELDRSTSVSVSVFSNSSSIGKLLERGIIYYLFSSLL
jgi:hypothetical protein